MNMEKHLIVSKVQSDKVIPLTPRAYPGLSRLVENNLMYIANLIALEQWYLHVRKMFFEHQEFGPLIFTAVLENLQIAKEERVKRLKDMAAKMAVSSDKEKGVTTIKRVRQELYEKSQWFDELLIGDTGKTAGEEKRTSFLDALIKHKKEHGENYIGVIQSLSHHVSAGGTEWLDAIVNHICGQAKKALPALNMFKQDRSCLT